MSAGAAQPLDQVHTEPQPKVFDISPVQAVMRRARAAQALFADVDQARADDAVRALAWSLYKPENAKALAELAVEDTGLGNVADKIVKKQRKTFGTLRDLLRGAVRRDHRGGCGTRPGQIRQADGRHRRRDALYQPRRDAGEQGHDGPQRPQRDRHCTLAAGFADDATRRRTHAPGTRKSWFAGGPCANPAGPDHQGGDGSPNAGMRSRRRHGFAGQRPARSGERHPCDRCRSRQRRRDDRRNRGSRRGRCQDRSLEDLRQLDVLLLGECRRDHRQRLRQGDRGFGARWRVSLR